MLTTTASIFHIYLYTPTGYVKYRAIARRMSRDYVRKVALWSIPLVIPRFEAHLLTVFAYSGLEAQGADRIEHRA